MRIIEIRDLDGPNLFLSRPAIKLEVEIPSVDHRPGEMPPEIARLASVVRELHAACDCREPAVVSRQMEAPGHYVVAWSWSHRRFAMALARHAFQLVDEGRDGVAASASELRSILGSEPEEDDLPKMVPTASRTVPIIAVTGTNGKTTTSRVISHSLRHVGRSVGTTSSAGVFINGDMVISGDYSGPSGAQRVLQEPGIDVAVLETARGGMLLRGLAFESCDVAVVTNVSADHLGMHGVLTLEGLAEVKSIVPKHVRPEGVAVLNADDPLVLAMREVTPGRPFLVTRHPDSSEVQAHIEAGGWALTIRDMHDVIWWHDGQEELLTSLRDIPMTFAGRAPHMVENALCAAGALLGIGLTPEEIKNGLQTFRNSAHDNRGRLNVYELNDAKIILDFAHNVAGLKQLISFGRSFVGTDGKLTAVIGTAGDRDDSVFQELAAEASGTADAIVLKDTHKYLRGRERGEMLRLMRDAVRESGRAVPVREAGTEREASLMAFQDAGPGDVVVLMCIEDYDYLLPWLDEHGMSIS